MFLSLWSRAFIDDHVVVARPKHGRLQVEVGETQGDAFARGHPHPPHALLVGRIVHWPVLRLDNARLGMEGITTALGLWGTVERKPCSEDER